MPKLHRFFLVALLKDYLKVESFHSDVIGTPQIPQGDEPSSYFSLKVGLNFGAVESLSGLLSKERLIQNKPVLKYKKCLVKNTWYGPCMA